MSNKKITKVLIIIPAYNEEKSIERVIASLQAVQIENVQLDYVIINDCSKDSTRDICLKKHYNFVDLTINLGIGGGVQSGYKYAVRNNYDIAVQMDGDGQHDPKYLERLIRPVMNGEADMAIGSRFIEKEGFQSSGMRRAGINILRGLIKLLGKQDIRDTTSGFRATNRQLTAFYARNYAQDYPEPEAIMAALLNHYRVTEVPVVMNERQEGESSIKALSSVYYMIKVSLAIVIYKLKEREQK